ncbi:MAG: chemotaxis response regulator protein-glutamate methylesterase [Lachnospiraceae bacterium]|nr:chemotaxis response regulator protein-glutamate methylesterase [Lachnospiraceae bacterium]
MANEKNILVVDDSALMRRLVSDIINSDSRYIVGKTAHDGEEALKFISKENFDAIILDVNMPKMGGLELLRELQKKKINVKVMMFSSTTAEGTRETIEALELGAVDFIKKPDSVSELKDDRFKKQFLEMLTAVSGAKPIGLTRSVNRTSASISTAGRLSKDRNPIITRQSGQGEFTHIDDNQKIVLRNTGHTTGTNKIVAIACSTGGPRALHSVIPKLPKNLNAPVLLVQHMPAGFTKSLADRLDSLSEIKVKEAEDGEIVEKGCVYIAAGGKHMNAGRSGQNTRIYYSDEPIREGVKPSANYMYESLMDSSYDGICCAVLTGMGADGTVGIRNLDKKKKIYVIAQDEPTSAVYGMPKAVALAGLVNEIQPLEKIAEAITKDVGVR